MTVVGYPTKANVRFSVFERFIGIRLQRRYCNNQLVKFIDKRI